MADPREEDEAAYRAAVNLRRLPSEAYPLDRGEAQRSEPNETSLVDE